MGSLHVITVILLGATTILAQLPTCPDEDIAFFPSLDCTKYYICDNGLPVEQECPPPLYYSEEQQYCDFPENVPECVEGTRAPGGNTTRPTNPTSQTTGSSVSPTEPTTVAPPGNNTTPLPNGCPVEGLDKIPNPASCSSYFICTDGVPHLNQCAEGLQFNPAIKECDFPENVGCTDPVLSSTSNPLPECPDEGTTILPHPGNSSLYVICTDKLPQILSCTPGSCFHAEWSSCVACVDEQGLDTDHDQITACKVTEGDGFVYIPSRGSCQEYHVCDNGEFRYTRKCRGGYRFDFLLQVCVEGVGGC